MTPEQRLAFAMEHGEKMHPQYKEEFDNAVSFNWSTTPWIEGCLAHFPRAMIRTFYPFLIRPERGVLRGVRLGESSGRVASRFIRVGPLGGERYPHAGDRLIQRSVMLPKWDTLLSILGCVTMVTAIYGVAQHSSFFPLHAR